MKESNNALNSVSFTQFLRPDGRRREVTIDVPADIAESADTLISMGARLEIEVLLDGTVSATIERYKKNRGTEVLAIELCNNGPEVPIAINRLIKDALIKATSSSPAQA